MESDDLTKEMADLLKQISEEQTKIIKQQYRLFVSLASLLEAAAERDPELPRLYQTKLQQKLLQQVAQGGSESFELIAEILEQLGKGKPN